MLQKSSREESLGCLFGLVGGIVGFLMGQQSLLRHAEEIRNADPDAVVCGLSAFAGLFGGMFLGGIVGTIGGMVLHHVIPPPKPKD